MRLIDADRLLSGKMKSKYYHLPNGDIAIPIIDIENAPSAEPERKWTPCSERLPLWVDHVDDMVLVCYGNGSIRFDTCMNGEWVHGNPIAWMPLPEPWGGDR